MSPHRPFPVGVPWTGHDPESGTPDSVRAAALAPAHDVMILLDPDGIVEHWSPALRHGLGIDPKEWRGRAFVTFFDGRDRDRAAEALSRSGDGVARAFSARPGATDAPFPLRWSVAPVFDREGRRTGYMAVAHDSSIELQASKRLRAAAREWEVTFDAVETQLIVLDPEDRVRRMNRAARLLAGLEHADAAVGIPLGVLGSGEPWRSLSAAHEESRRTGRSVSRKLRDADSERSWFLCVTPIDWEGAPWGALLVARDMTSIDCLQDSIRQNETMTILGRLVAGVAHEVRNPLFAISAIVDTWEQERREAAATDPLIRALRSEVARMNGLMRDLLDYSRPASLTWSPEPIQGVLEEVRSICAPLARNAGVTLHAEAAESLPEVLMDRPRIVQVLQNLVDNALRHSPQGGRVTLEAAIEGSGPFRNLVIGVRDEGLGFSDSALRRAFEPFFTERPAGTGLGLSIVEHIVHQHGAKIQIGNAAGGGAVVTVRFPYAGISEDAGAAERGAPATASAGGAR